MDPTLIYTGRGPDLFQGQLQMGFFQNPQGCDLGIAATIIYQMVGRTTDLVQDQHV